MTSLGTASLPEPLQESLRKYPISQLVQDDVSQKLWTKTGNRTTSPSPTYFAFYAERVGRHLQDGKDFCLQNHADIVWICQQIIADASRDEIHTKVKQRLNDNDTIDQVIDLCATLLVMTEIEKPRQHGRLKSYGLSGRTPIYWETGPLSSVIAGHFAPQIQYGADKLGRIFTARNLHQIGGIEIKWTTNIADHLRLVDDDRAVFIFQGASFLQFQNSLNTSLLPKQLITETLDTFALLFPSTDRQTRAWFKTIRPNKKQLERGSTQLALWPEQEIAKCGALQTSQRRIENFSIWHDRLIILKQAFDESQPASLSQWWHDRRNRVQWYTFWVAILVFIMTMVFGVVQSVEGGLQVYLSYKALRQEEGG